MSAETQPTGDWVELADRFNDGLDVRLLWNRSTGKVKVTVTRAASGRRGELRVAPEDALTAFNHPFAYKQLALAGGRRESVVAVSD